MTTDTGEQSQWAGFVALVLACIGALIAIGGSLAFFLGELRSSGWSVWPLPALALLDWAVLGAFGFFGAYFTRKPSPAYWPRAAWFVPGALLPLGVLGGFSIGPLVLFSLLFFLASAILLTIQQKLRWLDHLGLLLVGAVTNLGFLLILIVISDLAR